MRAFKTRWFARFARRELITDASMREAIERAERGAIDTELGGGLIKQRVARRGQGRSGGYRAIVAYRVGQRAVFLFGFAKSKLDNIGADELLSLRSNGKHWLDAGSGAIRKAIEDRSLEEVGNGEEE